MNERDLRLIHERDGDEHVLATQVTVADSLLAQARGLMFRRSIPDDYALLFQFERTRKRGLHMMFVPFDIDAVWVRDGTVTATKRLSAWTGYGAAVSDTIVELPAGAAAEVQAGDRMRTVDDR